MAFLMLLHEKMRLQRKVNKLTLRQLKMSSSKERITKNISRVQKMYSSRISKLETDAKNAQSIFTNWIQQTSGLSTGINPYNFQGNGGISQFVLGQMAGFLNGGIPVRQKDGKDNTVTIAPDQFQAMMQDYYVTGLAQQRDKDDNNKLIDNKFGNGGYSSDEVAAFKMAMNQAQQNQAIAQSYVQQSTTQYQSNVSIWLENEKEKLEAEQDAVLAPLEAEETEMDLEKESCEAQLADAKARLESIKQACSEGIKDSAPTFGLG